MSAKVCSPTMSCNEAVAEKDSTLTEQEVKREKKREYMRNYMKVYGKKRYHEDIENNRLHICEKNYSNRHHVPLEDRELYAGCVAACDRVRKLREEIPDSVWEILVISLKKGYNIS